HAKLSAATAGDALWTAAPRMALGRSAGSAQLRAFNRSDMNSLLPAGPEAFRGFPGLVAAEAEEVPVARLDDALDALGIDSRRTLLKIDTQGSELAVLEGAGRLLERVLLLQLEVPVTPIYEGAPSWLDLLLPVDRLGFRPVLLSPGYFSKRLLRQIDLDVVFRRAATSDGRTA